MKVSLRPALLLGFLLAVATSVAAQATLTNKTKARLPRLGVIKDYPATGMMAGCGNLYFELPKKPGTLTTDYVYLARGDGSNAWLNLNGRDTRLKLIRTKPAKKNRSGTKFYYRAGKTQITVSVTNSGHYEDDYPSLMTITLRRGHLVRRVKAVGSTDC